MTRDTMNLYLATNIGAGMQDIYERLDRFIIEARDTLTEEFQVACALMAIFEARAEEYLKSVPGSAVVSPDA